MKQLEDTEVGGHTFLFTQMHPLKATRISLRLLKMVGGQLGGAVGAIEGGTTEALEFEMKTLGESITKTFNSLEEEEALDTIKKLLDCVLYNGKNLNMNNPIFVGNISLLFKVVFESAKVNFSDFFDGSSDVVAGLKEKIKATMAAMAPTGKSGDSSSQE